MKAHADYLTNRINEQTKTRALVTEAIQKLDSISGQLRSELPHSIEWATFAKLRSQFAEKRTALNREIELLQNEYERETAPMIKPQPKGGMRIDGYDL